MNKKQLLILILIFSIIIISVCYYFFKTNFNKGDKQDFFTGALEEKLTDFKSKTAVQASVLREQLPLNTQEFQVDFDYKKFVFVVTLQAPYEENKQKFMNWLLVSGYESIPKTDITFLIPE